MIDTNNENIEALNKLREEISGNNASLLLGAGFSKNVDHELFPTWNELLYVLTPIILEYYFSFHLS